MRRSLIIDTHASSCYFRTSVEGDGRKALIQITERCNLPIDRTNERHADVKVVRVAR